MCALAALMSRLKKYVTFDTGDLRRRHVPKMTSNITCTVEINSACHSYQLGRECYISELHRFVLKTAESDENTRFAKNAKLLLYCAESPLNIFDKVGSIEHPAQIKAQFITENTHSEPDFTKFNVRFRIPIDILELSRLSPLEYLTKFTEVKTDVAEFYKIKYGKHSRMQKMIRVANTLRIIYHL